MVDPKRPNLTSAEQLQVVLAILACVITQFQYNALGQLVTPTRVNGSALAGVIPADPHPDEAKVGQRVGKAALVAEGDGGAGLARSIGLDQLDVYTPEGLFGSYAADVDRFLRAAR